MSLHTGRTLLPIHPINGAVIPVGTAVKYAVNEDRTRVGVREIGGAARGAYLAFEALASTIAEENDVDDLLSRVETADLRPDPRATFHVVTSPSIRSAKNARELCERVGLDWRVEPVDLVTTDGRPSSARSLRRVDTGDELNVVSDRYRAVQNVDALSTLDPVVEAGCPFVGAGFFSKGARVYAQVDLSVRSEIVKGDSVKHLLHVRAGHDGSAIYVVRSDVRIVCANTLARATKTGARLFKVRHTASAAIRLADARAAIAGMVQEIEDDAAWYRSLAQREFSAADVREVMDAVLGTAEERAKEGWRRDADALMSEMWRNQSFVGADLAGPTAWGALNVVTQYTSHVAAGRSAAPTLALHEGEPARMADRAVNAIRAIMAR